jgi:hypothetical protein
MGVTIGVAGIVGALFHLFDGPTIAKEIGFTRGDGGFQTEVGFGDLALGVAAVLFPLVGLLLYAARQRLRRWLKSSG